MKAPVCRFMHSKQAQRERAFVPLQAVEATAIALPRSIQLHESGRLNVHPPYMTRDGAIVGATTFILFYQGQSIASTVHLLAHSVKVPFR